MFEYKIEEVWGSEKIRKFLKGFFNFVNHQYHELNLCEAFLIFKKLKNRNV
jgi:hypothetical protein